PDRRGRGGRRVDGAGRQLQRAADACRPAPCPPCRRWFDHRVIPRTMADMTTLAAAPDRLRQQLLCRIRRQYEPLTELLTLGDTTLSFTRIADPNRVLDDVAEAEDRREKVSGDRRNGDALHLPYWAELWDSALGV